MIIVRQQIREILNEQLPTSYERDIFTRKIDVVYQHFYEQALMGYANLN